MQKQQFLTEAKERLSWYRTLKNEEFTFNFYVRESSDDCGTVCCLWGWEPRFNPDWLTQWKTIQNNKDSSLMFLILNKEPTQVLSWPHLIIKALYFPFSQKALYRKLPDSFCGDLSGQVSLKEVLDFWEIVIRDTEAGLFDHLFNTES